MIKESYTENFYSYNSKYINNALALRPPQHESLEIFARLCDTISLAKNPTTIDQIKESNQAELAVLDTEVKKAKKITQWASEAAAEFYAEDLAAVILGEIGDISRFSNASKLAAYAGIDASVSQSGEYQSSSNKMSKRGSPYLRKALFNAALIAAFHDPVFSAFYQKKRNEGKHHLTAIGAVARKLCNTIFAVLKYNTPYKLQL